MKGHVNALNGVHRHISHPVECHKPLCDASSDLAVLESLSIICCFHMLALLRYDKCSLQGESNICKWTFRVNKAMNHGFSQLVFWTNRLYAAPVARRGRQACRARRTFASLEYPMRVSTTITKLETLNCVV